MEFEMNYSLNTVYKMKLIFNILWLDVNNVNFTNTLPIEKTEDY
jgi:hypothetical protein